MSRSTPEQTEKTRQDILTAAEDLFSKKGLQTVSLEEIAKHANVSRGAIYWHFKGKEHILEAVLNQNELPLINWTNYNGNFSDSISKFAFELNRTFSDEKSLNICLILFAKYDCFAEVSFLNHRINLTQDKVMSKFESILNLAKMTKEIPQELNIKTTILAINIVIHGLTVQCFQQRYNNAALIESCLKVIEKIIHFPL